jgi:DNA-binding transcriptional LysR family regulator
MLDCNLEYFRVFHHVAQLGSITKAADALFISQPAVTRSIRKLEEYLKCNLFVRDSKGTHLTHEGARLFHSVDKAFACLVEGEKQLQQMVDFEMGKLEIGATETALYYFLLPKIEAFRVQYPQINIHVTGSSTKDMFRLLQDDAVDVALAVSPIEDGRNLSEFLITPMYDFQDVFVAGPFFNHLKGRVLTANELSRLPLVMVESGTSARNNIDHWFESQGVIFEPDYTVRTTSTIMPFVRRNLGIGVMPTMFAKSLLESEDFFTIETDKPIPTRQILLMSKKSSEMSRLCNVFVDFLTEHVGVEGEGLF